MDDFAKRYTLVLVVVVAVGLAWWFFNRDTIAGDINATLDSDSRLSDYPYDFRVASVEDGVARALSPRSARVPVMQFLRAAFPQLSDTPVDHPDMMAAQYALVARQARAAEIITAHPEVRAIRWQLDEQWYTSRGIYLQAAR